MAGRGDQPRFEIGRVHLRVADVDRAVAFYGDVLGFGVALRIGVTRVFLTADGRHHHIVLYGGAEDPASSHHVSSFSLRYAGRGALSTVFRRLADAGVTIEAALDLGTAEALTVVDPDGHRIELYCERDPAEYPRTPVGEVRVDAHPLDLAALRAAAEASDDVRVGAGDAGALPAGPTALTGGTRSRLSEMRVRLLNLHKVLLDDARAAYEMDRGNVGSNVNLLQLVINDPWFAWLHPLSELVVRIDEVLQPDVPATEADAGVLLDQVARLLAPGGANGRFAERYYEALQRQPAVIMAHAEVRRILKESR